MSEPFRETIIDTAQVGIMQVIDANPSLDGVHEGFLADRFHGNGTKGARFFSSLMALKNDGLIEQNVPLGQISYHYRLSLTGERAMDAINGRDSKGLEHAAALQYLKDLNAGTGNHQAFKVRGIGPVRAFGIISALTETGYLQLQMLTAADGSCFKTLGLTQRGRTVLDRTAPRWENS